MWEIHAIIYFLIRLRLLKSLTDKPNIHSNLQYFDGGCCICLNPILRKMFIRYRCVENTVSGMGKNGYDVSKRYKKIKRPKFEETATLGIFAESKFL